MSRIGNNPIELPQDVSLTFGANNSVVVKGKLGELSQTFHSDLSIKLEGNLSCI